MKREEEKREGQFRWLYGLVAGSCVAAMQIGVGLLQPDYEFAVLLGAAQGLLVCSLTLICGGILEWLLTPVDLPEEAEEEMFHPARQRVREFGAAFEGLAHVLGGTWAEEEGGDRVNRIFSTRLRENREAMAVQLGEMAQILNDTADHVWDTRTDESLEEHLKKKLRAMGLSVHGVLVYSQENKRQEVYLTLSTRRQRCVAVKEVAAALSRLLRKAMMPARDSRAFVGSERATVLFVERTNFEVICGVEKAVKQKEKISGDSFSLYRCREAQFVAALSDGMGSGVRAYKESERVMDLLEQFLGAGFTREGAVRMINAGLLVQAEEQRLSTIDMSCLDLYTGVCEFLKAGAATTFIRRENWVETIASTSLPAGIFHQPDLDCTEKKLYDGDMVIMVTDGVLDALPESHEENLMKDIILEHDTGNPKELAAYILNRVLQYHAPEPRDDMTVLVMGVVKY